MAEESMGSRRQKNGGWVVWLLGILLLMAAGGTWWTVNDQSKKMGELQTKLEACERKPKLPCDPALVVAKKKKAHKHKKTHGSDQRVVTQKAQPKQAPTVAHIQEEKFDSSVCGQGTEIAFSKANKPYCRVVLDRPVAPVVKVVEAPKQTQVICEKPLIRELRDDGSVACIQVAPPVQQATGQALPPGCYMDGPRLMCPTQEEAGSASSWVPWAIGGAAVLGVAAILHNRNRGGGSSPPPVVISQPPVVVSQPPTFTPGPPGVNSLPPSFPR